MEQLSTLILLQWKQISFEVDVLYDISVISFITKCFVDSEEQNSYVTNNSNAKLLGFFFSLMEIFLKKCIPKNSQNSQEKTCASIIVYRVYCNKKRARTHVIFCKKDSGMVVFL